MKLNSFFSITAALTSLIVIPYSAQAEVAKLSLSAGRGCAVPGGSCSVIVQAKDSSGAPVYGAYIQLRYRKSRSGVFSPFTKRIRLTDSIVSTQNLQSIEGAVEFTFQTIQRTGLDQYKATLVNSRSQAILVNQKVIESNIQTVTIKSH